MSDRDNWSAGSDKSRRRRFTKTARARSPSHCPNSDAISVDVDSITILSSPQTVSRALSLFDARKRNIIESIGFGGILCLPSITNDNKQFAIWLLKRLNSRSRSLSFGGNFSLTVTSEHVGKISGLGYSGDDITDSSLEAVSEQLAFKTTKLAFLGSKVGIVEAAEKFVVEELPCVLTQELVDNFKIAFVIFIMGRLLAPSHDHPDGNTNFWGALQDPDRIPSYNWSSYVLSNILDSASLLNWVVLPKRPLNTVAGCPLILQNFYLDNIDFGILNKPHGTLPRWQMFSSDHMCAMIEADKIVTANNAKSTEFGKTKMIREGQSCYTFGNNQSLVSPIIVSRGPSPVTTSFPRHSFIEQTSTPDNSDPESSIKFSDGSPLPTMLKNVPSIEKDVLDFGVFIRKKYQGQVDPKLLDDLKLHNARCLGHLAKLYRGLAAEIVNENTKLAIKMIENHGSFSSNNAIQPANGIPTPRRRRYNDIFTATDSSTEGEDNSMHCKVPRTRIVGDYMQGTSGCNNSSAAMLHTETHLPPQSNSFATQSYNELNTLIPKAAGNDLSPVTVSPATELKTSIVPLELSGTASRTSVALAVGHRYREPVSTSAVPSHTPDSFGKRSAPTYSSGTFTPDGSLRSGFLSPNISPTTENQAFSGACLSVRMLDSIQGIDLNATSFEAEYNVNSEPKKKISPGPLSLSHWEMQLSLPAIDPVVHNQFFKWLSTTNSIELVSEWVVHYIPRFVKISGSELKEQFVFRKSLSLDTFDVAIRHIRQLDNYTYPGDIPLRWRLLLESDYAMHVLGSENPVENNSIRYQFVGSASDFEVSRCRMFFVPVHVHSKWWCYAWDMKTGVVFIIDPAYCNNKEDVIINKHCGTIKQLGKSLEDTAKELFIGWSPKFSSCHPSVLQFVGTPCERYESGIVTLFCIMHFNGRNLAVHPNEENLDKFRSHFLYQLLEIENNGGRKPHGLIHDV